MILLALFAAAVAVGVLKFLFPLRPSGPSAPPKEEFIDGCRIQQFGHVSGVMYEEPGESPLFFYYACVAGRPLLVPSNEIWPRAFPAWAAAKRTEILDRIRSRIGRSFIEYSDEATKQAWIREPDPPVV